MNWFIVLDLLLLAVFLYVMITFLYKRRKRLDKEGWLILYKTTWGMKLIDRIGKKYTKTLKVASYLAVGLGYLLMAGMVYLSYTLIKTYLLYPSVVAHLKVPPITPLLPYFTELPGLRGLFPTFYFLDFIIAILIVASVHEFSHGIFMRRYNIKIKSTGFAFLKWFPAFLGAFVEQDEKSMVKAKNFEQRAVLSAGTFANTVTAVAFFGLLALFFTVAFSPAGVSFQDYVYDAVALPTITSVNGVAVTNPSEDDFSALVQNATFNTITTDDETYVGIKGFVDENTLLLYLDAPAIRAQLNGAITTVDETPITSVSQLSDVLSTYAPGDDVTLTLQQGDKKVTQTLTLAESPVREDQAWLGVAFVSSQNTNLFGRIFGAATLVNNPTIYYESPLGEAGWFIYNLLWWVALVNLAVALFNMLPAGGLDGGRFFYLALRRFGASENVAMQSFKWVTYLFLFLLFALMALWAFALIF